MGEHGSVVLHPEAITGQVATAQSAKSLRALHLARNVSVDTQSLTAHVSGDV